jgi:Histidine kinase-, DNA gyrase B-, and HSP90-like ATPase
LTDEAKTLMTSADFAALTLSVLLHDCGMHLTGDTFVELISPTNKLLTRLDKKTWKELWDEFLLEAKRFDGRQLRSLFGSPDPISEPPDDPADYTLKHRLLIGEFLRRHHPRLAHEISVFGFPARNGERLKLLMEGAGDLAEISGLIARSHGMHLRDACEVFKEHFHGREYQDIHPPVIMAALRIADYLQVQPERAPQSALRLHKLRSPLSEGEWRVHQSVRNITLADDDPEAIFVDAQPETVETFLKFKHWAQSFQQELDSTWASLGEVYGRYGDRGFDKFKLKLRRLRTSIDDEKRFAESVPYLPAKIAFEASSPDLLGLLVAPLYGNKPEVGLRELIQNSLDSVVEREHLEGNPPTEKLAGEYDTDVVVYPVLKDNEIVSVIVEDRGIGMDADVVKNYFLRAGASFRNSPQRKKSFATDEGQSDIARTGRFGIGALAGFLLGSTIKVETRRLGEAEGLQFSAELDKEATEVTKCTREIGTKISIQIDDKKREAISLLFSQHSGEWDWYCNSHPKLIRLDHQGNEIEPRFVYSANDKWVSIDVPIYSDVRWGFHQSEDTKYRYIISSALYGNGIFVCDLRDGGSANQVCSNNKVSPNIRLATPTVLVADKSGHLPVNLQRDDIVETDDDLSEAIRRSMAQELIAQAIAIAPNVSPFDPEVSAQLQSRKLTCSFRNDDYYNQDSRPHWCWEEGGWRVADLGIATKKPYLLVLHDDIDLSFLEKDQSALSDVSLAWKHSGASQSNFQETTQFFRSLVKDNYWNRASSQTHNGNNLPFQTVFSDKILSKLTSGRLPNYLAEMFNEKTEQLGSHVVLKQGAMDHPVLTKLKSAIKNADAAPFSFTFVGGANQTKTKDVDILVGLWSGLIGETAIPTVYESREAAFPVAYSELGDRIEYHKELLKKSSK